MQARLRRSLLLLASALAAGAARPALAHGIVVLSENGVAQYQTTLSAARARLQGRVTVIDVATPGALDQAKQTEPQVIVAVGTKPLTLARAVTDIPVVYCTVLYPELHGLGGPNVTGVPLEIPAQKQLEQFHELAPRVKRVGLIYSQATAPFAAEAVSAAPRLGLKLVAQSIGSAREVADAFAKMSGQIDALLLVPDSKVMSTEVFNYLLRASLDANVALFGFLEALTSAGALASLSPDYQDIGTRCGELAMQAVERGRASLPPKTYSRGALSINLKTAERLGISVDETTLKAAKRVFR